MCEDIDQRLILGGDLTPAEAAHQASCPRCRRLVLGPLAHPRPPMAALPSAGALSRAVWGRRARTVGLIGLAALLLAQVQGPAEESAPPVMALGEGTADVFDALDLVADDEAEAEEAGVLALLDPYEEVDPTDPMSALLGEGAL